MQEQTQDTQLKINNKEWLEKAACKHGVILFRGLPAVTAKDFDDFASAFGYQSIEYIGGAAPRTSVVGGVFTANEAPPHLGIVFHHELAQTPRFPRHLFFFCETPPTEDGQTPLCLSNVVLRRLQERYPAYIKELREKKVKYTRYLPDGDDKNSTSGRGWQSTWLTKDRDEAARKCRSMGSDCEWMPNGSMKVTTVLPAIRLDERTGKELFFNQCGAAHPVYGWNDSLNDPAKACTFADGTPLPRECVMATYDLMNEIAIDFKWQKGDICFVDNLCVQHGRRKFAGPRRILAWLAQ